MIMTRIPAFAGRRDEEASKARGNGQNREKATLYSKPWEVI